MQKARPAAESPRRKAGGLGLGRLALHFSIGINIEKEPGPRIGTKNRASCGQAEDFVSCSRSFCQRAVRSGWPSQKSQAAKSASAPCHCPGAGGDRGRARPRRSGSEARRGRRLFQSGREVSIARPVGGDQVVEDVEDGLEAFAGRGIGETLSRKTGLQLGEALVEAGGLVEGLARLGGAGVTFHQVAGRERMEHLLFGRRARLPPGGVGR